LYNACEVSPRLRVAPRVGVAARGLVAYEPRGLVAYE